MTQTWLDIERGPAARGWSKGYWSPRNTTGSYYVWHTTGGGPARRHAKDPKRWPTPFDAAVWLYTKAMKAGPHIVICGETGRSLQLAPLDVSAWHVGKRGSAPYFKRHRWEWSKDFDWWRDRWNPRGIFNPTELAGGTAWDGKQANPNARGVEITPVRGALTGRWSDATYAEIQRIMDMSPEIPQDLYHQVGHSDVHPRSRTRRGKGWDPTPAQFDPIADSLVIGC